jgi:hypothetical protein
VPTVSVGARGPPADAVVLIPIVTGSCLLARAAAVPRAVRPQGVVGALAR